MSRFQSSIVTRHSPQDFNQLIISATINCVRTNIIVLGSRYINHITSNINPSKLSEYCSQFVSMQSCFVRRITLFSLQNGVCVYVLHILFWKRCGHISACLVAYCTSHHHFAAIYRAANKRVLYRKRSIKNAIYNCYFFSFSHIAYHSNQPHTKHNYPPLSNQLMLCKDIETIYTGG